MMTCRLLCALLVLALCCCPSVCVTATGEDQVANSPSLSPASPAGAGVPGSANTSTAPSSTGLEVTLPGLQNPDGKGQASGKRTDTGRGTGGVADTPGNSDPTSPASDIEQGKGGSGRSGSSVPTVTVGSKSQGAGTVEIPGNDAKQPHGTPGLGMKADAESLDGQELSTESSTSESAEPTEKVQEPATISGTGGTEPLTQASTGQTQSGNPTSQGSSAGTGVPGSPDTPSLESIPKQEQAPGGATGRSGLPIPTGADQAKGETDPLSKPDTTTTNTTNAPATTTTTTTTTAPEASSTTTTEAPTTTITRAPSRLREIDGSLSSSAWVCAPLLLAVSALAYTTLG
ncbi:putative mucin TcMUCII [Trypanosoma cruzi]|uniref:Mucin TcMUCII, putative n=2 Tax=Trypanosoma cruzi TaxID=5693 RepID=Q4CT04_TRYCC|nr:mucin TcMUCII, putative [Trypanosoma cruzi]EAN83406.1 mucin TcMUCII, putative [Trypanosoma cruzi]PWV03958.1 putative mucin TcMUCII [Trypanosoma cruzi]RNC53200.1 mucin TcMUCII [Trypanosoma cruzi]|eukprot:XP_805257.1 mucin TcMUCII [Trypanosoma cruzi strain CL Brener]